MNDVPDIVNKIVKKICDEKNIIDYEIHFEGGNAKGEGFLGEISFLSIINKRTNEKLHVVLKKAFTSDIIRVDTPIRDSFLNEIYFYTGAWPKLNQFQIEANVSEKFESIAKCYAVSSEDGCELIVLENLKSLGFEVFEKTDTLTDDQVRLIFKHYSKFHALSSAYRHCHPEDYSEICRNILHLYQSFLDGRHFGDAIKHLCETCVSALQPGEDDVIIKEFQKYVDDGPMIFRKNLQYEGKNSCLLQGDCWSNNMLFKFDNSRKLTDIRIIDWQLFRFGSPVYDLSYSLYSGASKDVYENINELLKLYHESFLSYYKELTGEDSSLLLEDLKEDWKKYTKFGLIMSLMVTKMKLSDRSQIKDLTDLKGGDQDSMVEMMDVPFDEPTFKRRVRELLWHFYKIGSL